MKTDTCARCATPAWTASVRAIRTSRGAAFRNTPAFGNSAVPRADSSARLRRAPLVPVESPKRGQRQIAAGKTRAEPIDARLQIPVVDTFVEISKVFVRDFEFDHRRFVRLEF